MIRWLNSLQPWGVFLLRLVLGVTMAVHGWQKIASAHGFNVHNPLAGFEHFAHYIATLHLPYCLGYVSVLTEFLGGLFLIFGLFVRFAAFMIAGNMLVALVMVGIHQGFGISSYIVELLAIAIMLMLTGPGAAAINRN